MTAPEIDPQFEALLEHIRDVRGFDFTVYKRSTLMRRTDRRMQDLGIQGYGDYLDHLQVHPEEFDRLFDSILINVSGFFRDAQAWDYLRRDLVPRILEARPGGESIRVWSAGVATGEEAYSLAMAMAEAMPDDDFRHRVKIYATDLDEDALATARMGRYRAKDIQSVPEDLRPKYFHANDEGDGDGYVFRSEFRRSIIFGRHDLVNDAPISRLDLVGCRNTLMYFNSDAQARILSRLHFALKDDGFLFLGKAEMLFRHADLFSAVEVKHRVFAKVPRVRYPKLPPDPLAEGQRGEDRTSMWRLGAMALNAGPVAHLVVDPDGRLAVANAPARSLLGLRTTDVGRPLEELEVSYRPVELRLPIEQAHTDRRPIHLTGVERVNPGGQIEVLDVRVTPLVDEAGTVLGTGITFEDVTLHHELRTQLDLSSEKLETTNEELQSTNEELETTNEELQATNEELETMNEELQSTNEQLRTLNDELNERTEALNELNLYMGSIFTSLKSGMVVVDSDLRIHVWNARAEDLLGVDGKDVVGELLPKLDVGLPVALVEPVRACLEGEADTETITIDAFNGRGKPVRCRVMCSVLLGDQGDRQGVIMLIDEVRT
jgi:two-component system CheB/CheR fusion protein